MKHAGGEALDALEDLLVTLRRHEALSERKRGTFYRKSSAFLHFHEDPAGLFADMKIDGEFARFRVGTSKERVAFLHAVAAELARVSPAALRAARSRDTRRGV